MNDDLPLPLAGIRVLDFTRVLAGPFCTMLLGDMGADVIKVEDPAHGDDTRQWGPPWVGSGPTRQSAYFLSVNRNKRSLTLNLKSDAGRRMALALAKDSHIVVENFRPGQMARFGLGYDELRAQNAGLVYCSITGFGHDGPYAERPGYDFVIQGMSGLMSITGPVEGPPSKVGVALADVIAGLVASTSILGALRHAEQTGQGQFVDIALLDTQIAALVNVASNYLVSGRTPARYGNQHANIVPYQAFEASDASFVVAVGNDRQFATLCGALGRPDLAQDPRFASNPARVQHRETLIPILQSIFQERRAEEWVETLLSLGIPAGPIHDVAAALSDPQVEARGLVQETLLDSGELVRMVGPASGLLGTPGQIRLPPPSLGRHTEAILKERLGLDDATIAGYRNEGAI